MAWFCKRCIDEGVMDPEWLEADSTGVVFDIDDDQVINQICEGCDAAWFNRYGEPVDDCVESCELDPEYEVERLVLENEVLKQKIKNLEEDHDMCMRNVVDIFESFLAGKNPQFIGNSKLASLIYGYILKIKNQKI